MEHLPEHLRDEIQHVIEQYPGSQRVFSSLINMIPVKVHKKPKLLAPPLHRYAVSCMLPARKKMHFCIYQDSVVLDHQDSQFTTFNKDIAISLLLMTPTKQKCYTIVIILNSEEGVILTNPTIFTFDQVAPEAMTKQLSFPTLIHKQSGIECHHRTKDGHLYFTSKGIFFGYKKPLFWIPNEQVKSVAVSSVTSRTFNIIILTLDEQEIEFSYLDTSMYEKVAKLVLPFTTQPLIAAGEVQDPMAQSDSEDADYHSQASNEVHLCNQVADEFDSDHESVSVGSEESERSDDEDGSDDAMIVETPAKPNSIASSTYAVKKLQDSVIDLDAESDDEVILEKPVKMQIKSNKKPVTVTRLLPKSPVKHVSVDMTEEIDLDNTDDESSEEDVERTESKSKHGDEVDELE